MQRIIPGVKAQGKIAGNLHFRKSVHAIFHVIFHVPINPAPQPVRFALAGAVRRLGAFCRNGPACFGKLSRLNISLASACNPHCGGLPARRYQ
jgi:hypothetical protein